MIVKIKILIIVDEKLIYRSCLIKYNALYGLYALHTVYRESFAKEKVCGFRESWCIREHFLVLFLISH